MKEITEVLKAAYHWGRDNGEGRSDKNFNDFLNTSVVSKLEFLVNQEVEKRIAEILPTDKEGQVASFKRYNLHATDVKHQYKQAAFFLGWRMCLDEIRSRLTNQK